MARQLIYAATHGWRSPIRVGSHHFARVFAESYETLYVSHPISIASVFSPADNQLLERWRTVKTRVNSQHTPPNMQELAWFMPLAPGPAWPQNSRWSVAHGWRLCWPNSKRILQEAGYSRPDALWIDSLFQSYWPDLVEAETLCVRVADHPEHITRLSPSLHESFVRILQNASLIVTPTTVTAEYLNQFTDSRIDVIPNGVDVAHFTNPTAPPPEYLQDSKPKAVFVGALASWIDMHLLFECALLCPELSFYVIGPSHGGPALATPPNLHILGSRPYADIPPYLHHADVALAPFDVKNQWELINSIDAIKLYEYVAAGIPTVATNWEQSQRLAPYVTAVEQTPRAFADAIYQLTRASRTAAPDSYLENLDWHHRLSELSF